VGTLEIVTAIIAGVAAAEGSQVAERATIMTIEPVA